MDKNLLGCKIREWGKQYTLPGLGTSAIHILPVSGGGDSTVLAILLHWLYPEVDFKMVFTDTMADEPELYEGLDRLEGYLGKKITRISHDVGLYGLIEKYKGYLPSSSARWCTRDLKLLPFQKWMKQFDGMEKFMYVGIRSDEQFRLAFSLDDVSTEMPLLTMGIRRADVFAVLAATVGIPKYYSRRTRSGCSVCPFSRRSEMVGLMQEQPIEFMRGKAYEKLQEADLKRQEPAPVLWKEVEIAPNWMSLPMPSDGETIEGKVGSKTANIFGDVGVFIGAEFFVDGLMGMAPSIVWHQKVVSYSPTLGGIKRQLQDRYEHILQTAEVHDLTEEEARTKVKFAIYFIEAPADVLDLVGPQGESYTWHQGESYRGLEHIITWGTRVLHAGFLKEKAASESKVHLLSFEYEWARDSREGLEKVNAPIGNVVAQGWFVPQEPTPETEEIEEKYVACPMCSI